MRLVVSVLSVSLLMGCFSDSNTSLATAENIQVKEASMFSLFNKKVNKTYVIASPLSGILMKGGKPLAHTKILRRLTWNANEKGIVQEFTTDENGAFSVPVHEETFEMGQLTEFVASQSLFVNEEIEENFFWYSPKRTEELYSDYGSEIEGLVCDLENEEKRVTPSGADTYIFSKCTWINMP